MLKTWAGCHSILVTKWFKEGDLVMFGIVIDGEGNKKDFYVLDKEGYPIGYDFEIKFNEDNQVLSRSYRKGESLITENWARANAMNKPRWNGAEWVETALEAEEAQTSMLE